MAENEVHSKDIQRALKSKVTKSKVLQKYQSSNVDGSGKRMDSRAAVEKNDVDISKQCSNCDKKIKGKTKKAIMCKCKERLFCSHSCQHSSSHYNSCAGRMEPVKLEAGDMISLLKNNPSDIDIDVKSRIEKQTETLLAKCKHPGDIKKHAEDGDPVAQWMIGCSFSLRLASNKLLGLTMPEKYLDRSVAETDEMAIHWFKKAAEGGLQDGMMSLANKIWSDTGLKMDERVAFYWMAKALEAGSVEARVILEDKFIIGKEIKAITESLLSSAVTLGKEGKNFIGQQIYLIGPNLGNLLIAARHEEIKSWNGKTANGGFLYGFTHFDKLFHLQKSLGFIPLYVGGRAGSGGAETKLCIGRKERSPSNIMFRQGEKAEKCLDLEQANIYNRNTWAAVERTKYKMFCIHQDKSSQYLQAGQCEPCIELAKKRTLAVAYGLYSISIIEVIPGYGYGARYCTEEEGTLVQEIFKSYSMPEVCSVLQCLMNNPADLHPLVIAEDGNLFWPVIWYYGSVYNAVLECCGQKTVKAIYGKISKYRSNKLESSLNININPSKEVLEAFPATALGQMRMACGNEKCPLLDHEQKFLKCSGCKVRYFCSKNCLKSDWSKHKKECSFQDEVD